MPQSSNFSEKKPGDVTKKGIWWCLYLSKIFIHLWVFFRKKPSEVEWDIVCFFFFVGPMGFFSLPGPWVPSKLPNLRSALLRWPCMMPGINLVAARRGFACLGYPAVQMYLYRSRCVYYTRRDNVHIRDWLDRMRGIVDLQVSKATGTFGEHICFMRFVVQSHQS